MTWSGTWIARTTTIHVLVDIFSLLFTILTFKSFTKDTASGSCASMYSSNATDICPYQINLTNVTTGCCQSCLVSTLTRRKIVTSACCPDTTTATRWPESRYRRKKGRKRETRCWQRMKNPEKWVRIISVVLQLVALWCYFLCLKLQCYFFSSPLWVPCLFVS